MVLDNTSIPKHERAEGERVLFIPYHPYYTVWKMNIVNQVMRQRSIFFRHMHKYYTSIPLDINLLKSKEYADLSKDPVLGPNLDKQRLHTEFPIVVQKHGDVYWVRDGCHRTKRAFDLGHKEVMAYVLKKDDRYYNNSYD